MSAFARSLRRQALQKIRHSERLATAYRNRPASWNKIWGLRLGLLLNIVLFGVFGIGMVLRVATVLVLGPVVFDVLDGKPTEHRPSAGLGLACHAHFLSGILAITLAAAGRELFCKGLALLTYFPLPDSEGVRRSNQSWIVPLLVAGLWTYFVFRYAAIHHQVPFPQSLAMLPLAALHAWMIYVMAIVAVALFRPAARFTEAMGKWALLSLCGYAACMLSMGWPQSLPPLVAAYIPWPEHPPEWMPAAATYSGLLLPTGWVDAVAWYGVLRGEAWGWLFLLPCAALSALALWFQPRLIELREIRVSSQGQLTPVFADDPEPEAAAEPAAPAAAGNARPQPTTEVPSSPPAANREAVLKRLLSGPPLGKTDWPRGWPLERFLGRLLTERERVLVEHGDKDATLSWLVAASAAAAVTALILLVWLFTRHAEACGTLAAALSPMVCVLVTVRWSAKRPSSCGAVLSHPHVPLGFRETAVMAMKLGLFHLMASVPIVAVSLGVITAVVPLSKDAVLAPLIGTAASVVAICLVAPAFGFAHHIRYEFSLHRLAYLCMLAGLLMAAYAMLMLAFVKPHWPATLVLGMIVLAWAATQRRYFDGLYHSGRLDYVDWRPPRVERH